MKVYEGHRARLKEKFKQASFKGWQEYEVLEMLLTYALPRKDTKPLAKQLIACFGSLKQVLDADYEELSRIKGLGAHSATFLKFVKEITSFYTLSEVKSRHEITSTLEVVNFLKSVLGGQTEEQFLAIFIDASGKVLGYEVLHEGTVNKATVYPRKVARQALKQNASGVFIAHNHPSGTLKPSAQDIKTTNALKSALNSVEIMLIDHVIIAGNSYFSFKDQGYLGEFTEIL